MRSLKVLVVLLLAVCLLAGCGTQPDQTVTCGELSITLPGSFQDWSQDPASAGLSFSYADETKGVCGVFESKEYLQAYIPGLDAQRYAELFVESNSLASSVEMTDGIPTFSYTAEGDPAIRYLCGVFESGENFWVVQAYCASEDFEESKEEMWRYITSVQVN